MMLKPAPIIDSRTKDQIYTQLRDALESRLGIDALRHDPQANALLHVFARFSEHLIQRLNRVPEKNFVAFLNQLNISRRPPLAAWAPLIFTPVSKLPALRSAIVVPAGTKVAAAPGEGEDSPAVFETRQDLYVTDWKLQTILVLDPQTDCYANLSHLADPKTSGPGQFAFEVRQPVKHEFFIGHAPFLAKPGIARLQLHFKVGQPTVAPAHGHKLTWWMMSPDGEVALEPASDSTGQLSRSGQIVFKELPQWAVSLVAGCQDHWLGCRLRNRLPGQENPDHVAPHLPVIEKMTISATWAIDQAAVEAAFFNAALLDLSKDFYPFGSLPRFGDVFYLSCAAWATPGANIDLVIKLTNPASARGALPLPPVNTSGKPVIQWEYWNGGRWDQLICQDGTRAFTEDGVVSFKVPEDFVQGDINGMDGHWLRVRLIGGDYGRMPTPVEPDAKTASILSPPSIALLQVKASYSDGPVGPHKIITHNNLVFDVVDSGMAFRPFCPAAEPARRIYLGFKAPEDVQNTAGNMLLDLYFHISGSQKRLAFRSSAKAPPPRLTWEYYNGRDWTEARVIDTTAALTTPGMVRVDVAGAMPIRAESAITPGLCWVRALWHSSDDGCRPLLQRVLVNTVPADHAMTICNEILGASNGLPNQRFRTARVPLLEHLQLEVREPEMLSDAELQTIRNEQGQDAVTVVKDAHGQIEQIWVRWHEVNDFIKSTNRDRHYTVERQSGTICFGDGSNGLIPPAGSNNVRLAVYQTGGGPAGNKPLDSIAQLRNSVPFIDAVTNCEPASGGHCIEAWSALKQRGATELRHRRRAVTREDYEDLARLATPVVARAQCYPNRDLQADPDGVVDEPGIASLIVVPHDSSTEPMPDLGLLQSVAGYLDGYKAADCELVLLAPEYVQINIDAVIVAEPAVSGAIVAARCEKAIKAYLHPLRGGSDGSGWPFGRHPFESDFFGLLDQIDGLDHVRQLNVEKVEQRPGLIKSGLFLIAAGRLDVMAGL